MGTVKQYAKVVNKAGYAGKLLSPLDCASVMATIVKKTLSATQLKALNSDPITLIAAPGTGKYIQVDDIICALDYSGGALAGDNNLEFRETDGSGTKVSADLSYAFIQGTADAIATLRGIEAQTARLLNTAIVAVVPSADWTGTNATSTLTITVHYKVITPY